MLYSCASLASSFRLKNGGSNPWPIPHWTKNKPKGIHSQWRKSTRTTSPPQRKKTVATGEQRDPIRDFTDYQEYRVSDVIVRRVRYILYQTNSENVVQRQDIKFQGFEWYQESSWNNQTDAPHTREHTTQEGLTIRDGQETDSNFGVSATFKGLAVNAGGYVKNFSEVETSQVHPD